MDEGHAVLDMHQNNLSVSWADFYRSGYGACLTKTQAGVDWLYGVYI